MQKIGVIYAIILGIVALITSSCNRNDAVDENVINSYLTIDSGFQQSAENFSLINSDLYARIDGKAAEQPFKYAALQKEAHELEVECNKVIDYIRYVKVKCLHESDASIDVSNINSDTCVCKNPYDTNSAYSVMKDVAGDSIKIMVGKLKDNILKMSIFEDRFSNVDTNSSVYKDVESILSPSGGKSKLQNDYNCVKDIPLVGALSLLSELQAEIKNVETIVLHQLIYNLEGWDICIPMRNFDYIGCVVNSGREYEARIFSGYCDTINKQTVYLTHTAPFYDSVVRYDGKVEYKLLDNAKYDILQSDKQGRGIYKDDRKEPGVHEYGGLILYKTNYGDVWIPFRSAYIISK